MDKLIPYYTIIVSWLIFLITKRLYNCYPVVTKLNIPIAVTGGIVFAIIFGLIELIFNLKFEFSLYLRDLLLVIFFCCIGLSVRFSGIRHGGKPLVLLCGLSIILILLQNLVGVISVVSAGFHPLYGLLVGSIPFVGGYGSSLAWGTEFASRGLELSLEVSFACSTLGLISGGLIAGPTVSYLIKYHQITLPLNFDSQHNLNISKNFKFTFLQLLGAIALVVISIFLADIILPILKNSGLAFPRFLIAMIIALVTINFIPRKSKFVSDAAIDKLGETAFNFFIIIALISMQFSGLKNFLLPLLLILLIQIIVTVLYSVFVVFRYMGKDYEAVVMTGGTIGFGLSSLAVALATAKTVVSRHGPAPKALLLTALVGAALIDFANSLIIIILSNLPWFFVNN